jgi:trans-aconitate methyltransferase
MGERVARRLVWAVEQLGLSGDERVLEVGGGTGVAAALILDRLPSGFLLGIDRSPAAVAKAAARNAAAVAAGRAAFEVSPLHELRVDEPYDAALAVNVNAFWTGDADSECGALAAALHPAGSAHLVFETPGPIRPDLLDRTADNLARHRFATTIVRGDSADLAAVVGRLGG